MFGKNKINAYSTTMLSDYMERMRMTRMKAKELFEYALPKIQKNGFVTEMNENGSFHVLCEGYPVIISVFGSYDKNNEEVHPYFEVILKETKSRKPVVDKLCGYGRYQKDFYSDDSLLEGIIRIKNSYSSYSGKIDTNY